MPQEVVILGSDTHAEQTERPLYIRPGAYQRYCKSDLLYQSGFLIILAESIISYQERSMNSKVALFYA